MRLRLVVGALVAPVLPILLAPPAHAAGNHICVSPADAAWTCDQTVTTVAQATQASGVDSVASTILIGQGSHDVPTSGIPFNGSAAQVVQGSEEGETVLTMPDTVGGQAYVSASNNVLLQDFTVLMTGGANSLNDIGMLLNSGTTAEGITVDGTQTQAAQGVSLIDSTLTGSTITMPVGSGRAVFGQGGNTVTDTDITGDTAYGFSSTVAPDTLSRVTIHASSRGIRLDAGTVNVDNSVIELTAGNASGIVAENNNNSTSPKTVNAAHLTIVGGGANSRGVWAWAQSTGAQQSAVVNLANSIVRTVGGTDLLAEASNTLPAGQNSTATINVSYSDFDTAVSNLGTNGVGGVVTGTGNVDVDPAFANAAAGNYRLTASSPVVDAGDPAPGGPATDRGGNARVVDGDGDGTARRDMGAYELGDVVAPDTTVETGPSGPTSDTTPTFTFSSEAGATFECQVDGGGFDTCSGPGSSHTTGTLGDGPHTFEVRASDLNGNTDGTAASRAFTVDTGAPDTTITSGPSGVTDDATPSFTFASEAGATFECQVDSAVFAACTSPFTAPSLGNGPHTFAVRATDPAANVDASPATRSFIVDTVAPVVTMTKAPGKKVFANKVRFKFTSDEAGITFQCKHDGKPWKPCTSPHAWKVKLGKHVFRVRAMDSAGNVGAPTRHRFKRVVKS